MQSAVTAISDTEIQSAVTMMHSAKRQGRMFAALHHLSGSGQGPKLTASVRHVAALKPPALWTGTRGNMSLQWRM